MVNPGGIGSDRAADHIGANRGGYGGSSGSSGGGRGLSAAVAATGRAAAGAAAPNSLDSYSRARAHQMAQDDALNTDDRGGQVGAALAGMIGLHETPPAPGTYTEDPAYATRANWNFDPVRAGASLIGGATGVPGLAYLGGRLSDAMGNPLDVNLGPDVFGGGAARFGAGTPPPAGGGTASPVSGVAFSPGGGGYGGGYGSHGGDARAMGAAGSPGQSADGIPPQFRDNPGYADGGMHSHRAVVADILARLLGAGGGGGVPPQMSKLETLAAQYRAKSGEQPGMPAGAPPAQPAPARADGGGLSGRFMQGPGNGRSDDIDAKLADGEYVVPADVVSALGNGSSQSGSRALSQMVDDTRRDYRSHIAELPKPKR